ncbi:magnesium transporter CorA family protein [Patescibacteria group bacterium]|nr:magnesium transporter CorA family protein [Patescibacteria group bacterium]
MIRYLYRTIRHGKPRLLDKPRVGCWVDVLAPNPKELEELTTKLKLDPGMLTDALDPYEVPRIEKEGSALYIFVRVPCVIKGWETTTPILFVLSETFFVTIAQIETGISQQLETDPSFCTSQKNKCFMLFMSYVLHRYQHAITQIGKKANAMLAQIETVGNKEVIQLVQNEQVINEFLSAIIPIHESLQRFMNGKLINLFKDDIELLEDVYLTSGQLIALAKNQLMLLRNSRDAYSTIMTNNLNSVVKLFTALTVVLTLPTIVFSFYGMNVHLPLAEHPLAFIAILLGTVLALIGMLLYLFKRDWI